MSSSDPGGGGGGAALPPRLLSAVCCLRWCPPAGEREASGPRSAGRGARGRRAPRSGPSTSARRSPRGTWRRAPAEVEEMERRHLQRAAQVGALAGTVGLACLLAEAAEGRQLAGVEPVRADRASAASAVSPAWSRHSSAASSVGGLRCGGQGPMSSMMLAVLRKLCMHIPCARARACARACACACAQAQAWATDPLPSSAVQRTRLT